MGRAYVLRYAGKYEDARLGFVRVIKLAANDQAILLEAKEEAAWCSSVLGRYEEAETGLASIIEILDDMDGHDEDKARAWWRLGQTFWNQGTIPPFSPRSRSRS